MYAPVVSFFTCLGETKKRIIQHVKDAIDEDRNQIEEISASTPSTN